MKCLEQEKSQRLTLRNQNPHSSIFIFVFFSKGTIPTELGLATTLEWLNLLESTKPFVGGIPNELGQLTQLNFLGIAATALGGTAPAELALLTNLAMMSIQKKLTGQVPTELGRLTKLNVHLDMGNNTLTGSTPTQFRLFTDLEEAELGLNTFSGYVPSQFGLLTKLTKLGLTSNSLSGTVPLELEGLGDRLNALTLDQNPLLPGVLPEGLCGVDGECIKTLLN